MSQPCRLSCSWELAMPAKRTSYAARLATLSPGRIQTQSRTAAHAPISVVSIQSIEIAEETAARGEAHRTVLQRRTTAPDHEVHTGCAAVWTESGLKSPRICGCFSDRLRVQRTAGLVRERARCLLACWRGSPTTQPLASQPVRPRHAGMPLAHGGYARVFGEVSRVRPLASVPRGVSLSG